MYAKKLKLKSYNLKWVSFSNWIDKLYLGGTRADTTKVDSCIKSHNHTYLRRLGIKKVHLAHFRGNRFNIIFLNEAQVFYLHKHMIEFLTRVWGSQNKLLKSVLDDANNDLYISGCRALGLIDKFITGPLWKILESMT